MEEITTHHLTDDDQDLKGIYDEDVSDSGGSWRGSRCSLDDSRGTRHHKKVTHHSVTEEPLLSTINVALPDPAHITSRRVSFPELGANILHGQFLTSCFIATAFQVDINFHNLNLKILS